MVTHVKIGGVQRIILASVSPRRAELLSAAGIEFDVVPADVDESPRPSETPDIYVRRVAEDVMPHRIGIDLHVGGDLSMPKLRPGQRPGQDQPHQAFFHGWQAPVVEEPSLIRADLACNRAVDVRLCPAGRTEV